MKHLTPILAVLVLGATLFGWLRERSLDRSYPYESTPAESAPDLEAMEIAGGRGILAGRVLLPTGEPAADALVHLRDGDAPRWSWADATGRFTLEGVHPGSHEVAVTVWPYPPTTFSAEAGVTDHLLRLTEEFEPFPELEPFRASHLAGRILGEAGRDLGNFELLLLPTQSPDTFGITVPRRTRTDARGLFRVDDLAHGDYVMHVLPPWAAGRRIPNLLAPGERSLAHPDHTEPAVLLGTELNLRLAAGSIVGRATESRPARPTSSPIVGATVLVDDIEDPNSIWPPATTDADGNYEVPDLPDGVYRVQLRAGDLLRTVEQLRIRGGVTERVDFLDLEP